MNIDEALSKYYLTPIHYGPDEHCPTCPFCMARYASKTEVRPVIVCPVCQGQAALAIEALACVEEAIDQAGELLDIERLEELSEALAGYWQFEVRRRVRAIRKLVENEPQQNSSSH